MADNTTLNSGSGGDTIAADDISSVKYQRIKLIHGADGVNDGDVSTANGLPVRGTGTAGTANAGVMSVQGIASMTPVQVGDNSSSLTVDDGGTTLSIDDGGGAITVDGTVSISGTVTVDSELPAAATLGDDTANPSAPAVASFPHVYDGSTWDRLKGNSTDGMLVNLGTNNDVTLGAALPAGGNTIGDVTISGAALTSLQLIDDAVKADDAAFTPASDKVLMIGATLDDSASDSVDEGDAGALRMSARRELYTQIRDAAGNERGANVNASGQLAIAGPVTNAGTFAVQVDNTVTVGSHAVTNAGTFAVQSASAGDVAHDSADSGNPVKQGFKATTALSGLTLVASGDRTDGFAGVDGVQIVRPHCNLEGIVTGNVSNTDGASTEVIAAQAAGIKTYLTSIIITNTSASQVYVEIKDGTTVKITLPVPATGGVVFNPPVPLPGTAATAWNFDSSAAASTLYFSAIGFKSKV